MSQNLNIVRENFLFIAISNIMQEKKYYYSFFYQNMRGEGVLQTGAVGHTQR
jgi:hypothetical protein